MLLLLCVPILPLYSSLCCCCIYEVEGIRSNSLFVFKERVDYVRSSCEGLFNVEQTMDIVGDHYRNFSAVILIVTCRMPRNLHETLLSSTFSTCPAIFHGKSRVLNIFDFGGL